MLMRWRGGLSVMGERRGLEGFYDGVDVAVRQIDDMKTFANQEVSVTVKIATDDGRFYGVRIMRISKSEYER